MVTNINQCPSNTSISEVRKIRDICIKGVGTKLKSKRIQLTGQTLRCYLAVLQFMNYAEEMEEKGQADRRGLVIVRISWERNWQKGSSTIRDLRLASVSQELGSEFLINESKRCSQYPIPLASKKKVSQEVIT